MEQAIYSKKYFRGYKKEEGGYVCPSDIFYGRPQRAVNTWGHWKVKSAFVTCIKILTCTLLASYPRWLSTCLTDLEFRVSMASLHRQPGETHKQTQSKVVTFPIQIGAVCSPWRPLLLSQPLSALLLSPETQLCQIAGLHIWWGQ